MTDGLTQTKHRRRKYRTWQQREESWRRRKWIRINGKWVFKSSGRAFRLLDGPQFDSKR